MTIGIGSAVKFYSFKVIIYIQHCIKLQKMKPEQSITIYFVARQIGELKLEKKINSKYIYFVTYFTEVYNQAQNNFLFHLSLFTLRNLESFLSHVIFRID